MPPFDVDGSEERGRRELWISVAWVAASIVLLLLPVGVQQGVSSALRSTVLAPFIWTQESIGNTRLRAIELEALQARFDSTVALLAAQAPLAAENAHLRELLELRERTGPAFVSASVLRPGTRGSESMFLLDVGSAHGVAVNDPVVAADGLVGVVREVGPRNSLAMDWTHPDFGVSVMTLDGEVFGIVEVRPGAFREEDRLILNGIPFYTTLEEGERLVSSGQGSIFPRGILVGQVLSLAETEAGWRRGYWVEPAVPVGSVTHVLVITGEEGRPVSDLTHLWAPALPDSLPDSPGDPSADPFQEMEGDTLPGTGPGPAADGIPDPAGAADPPGATGTPLAGTPTSGVSSPDDPAGGTP